MLGAAPAPEGAPLVCCCEFGVAACVPHVAALASRPVSGSSTLKVRAPARAIVAVARLLCGISLSRLCTRINSTRCLQTGFTHTAALSAGSSGIALLTLPSYCGGARRTALPGAYIVQRLRCARHVFRRSAYIRQGEANRRSLGYARDDTQNQVQEPTGGSFGVCSHPALIVAPACPEFSKGFQPALLQLPLVVIPSVAEGSAAHRRAGFQPALLSLISPAPRAARLLTELPRRDRVIFPVENDFQLEKTCFPHCSSLFAKASKPRSSLASSSSI
jgi:hypothetical protein